MIILSLTYSYSQDNNFSVSLIDSIHGKSNEFSIDNFDNIYITTNDVILKLNSNLDTLFSTSLKSFFPSSIESSKSFRNLVFDDEKGTVMFLDNTLTEVYSDPVTVGFDLTDLDILQAVLVCESFNGNTFWVLDEANMQLVKLNQNLEIVTRIDNLNFLFENKESPIQMFERNDQLYIHFPNNGLAIFDSFGTYLKYIPIKSKWIDIQNNYLLSLNDNQITILELPFIDIVSILSFKNNGIKSFVIQKDKIYIQSDNSITIYSIKQKTNNK